jgi:hypothetical protein
MKHWCIVTCLLGFFCLMAIPAWAQDQGSEREQNLEYPQAGSFHLVDDVEITVELPGQKDTVCKLRFLEDWMIDPRANSILKQVVRWDSCCSEIFSSLPIKNGAIRIGNISHEFHLMDPHLVASGNKAFPEPDSMDAPTRQLQDQLIALVIARSDAGKRYHLSEQLLSVIFVEEWSINPTTLKISKKVRALTPLIWQRRQTETGEPINEAETGLPVYYKFELQQIALRNP